MKFSKMLLKNFSEFSTEMPDTNLIFMTATGMLSGKLVTKKDCDDSESTLSAIALFCQHTLSEYKKIMNFTDDYEIPDDDGYLVLKDVSLITSFRTITLPFSVIFWKDIIGFSFGQLPSIQQ